MFAAGIRLCVGSAAIFGAGRGTEIMWPEESPWLWWGASALIIAIWASIEIVLYRRRRKRQLEAVPVIPPEKTITEHGVLTMGDTGYPERLTTGEELKEGKTAPGPTGAPMRKPVGPAGIAPAPSLRELWLASPGAGRMPQMGDLPPPPTS